MNVLNQNELSELIDELDDDWNKSQKVISNTFAIKRVDAGIELICCGSEGDRIFFNRADSNLTTITKNNLNVEKLYDIVGVALYDHSYSLVDIPIPNGEISKFYDICRAVTKNTKNIYLLKNNRQVMDLINKLQPEEYAVLIIKED